MSLHARYVASLLWEFRWSLLVFWSLVVLGGLLLHVTYHDRADLSYPEACYAVFMLIFLEPYLDFPKEWYLQPIFFALPIIGLGAVAESLVRLGYLVFARKNRLPEWQRMMASVYRDHTVVVGLGKMGYRITLDLRDLGEPVVVIQRSERENDSLLEEVLNLEVPVIRGDGRMPKVLEQAGVRHARAVILATSDDLTNLDAGLTARDLNPSARIVLRLFDESLAMKVRGAFAMPAISTAHVSAPAFIAAATGRRIYQGFELAGQHLHLVDLTVAAGSGLDGLSVGAVQAENQINIVMHHGPDGTNVNPGHDQTMRADDQILVIAPIGLLRDLERRNRPVAAD